MDDIGRGSLLFIRNEYFNLLNMEETASSWSRQQLKTQKGKILQGGTFPSKWTAEGTACW
jgi:hypothetical protein